MTNDRFGVNMRQFCQEHEERLANTPASRELYETHLERLRWLQHERLVHLIVLALTVVGELFVLDLVLLHTETHPGSAVIMLALAVLLGFYVAHYFFLENTVQHWYRLAQRMQKEPDERE